jgi:hypothetical protein
MTPRNAPNRRFFGGGWKGTSLAIGRSPRRRSTPDSTMIPDMLVVGLNDLDASTTARVQGSVAPDQP